MASRHYNHTIAQPQTAFHINILHTTSESVVFIDIENQPPLGMSGYHTPQSNLASNKKKNMPQLEE